jgi:hypothetical protein
VSQSIGPGATDSTVPKPLHLTGFSLTRGSAPPSYNFNLRVRLNLSFTVVEPGGVGSAVIRLYRWNGAAWSRLTDLTFVAGGADAWTGPVTVSWQYVDILAASDKIGVNILSLGDNTAACTINSFLLVTWKSRTETSPTSATPNGEDVEFTVYPQNVGA